MLLADRRIELAFEAYGSGKTGPDFTITFRGSRGFNLEVTRLRRLPDATGLGASLLAKLRQLPPSTPNSVLLATDAGSLRLSAVFVSAEGADGEARATIWVNRSARIAMPEPAGRASLRCLRVDLKAAAHLHSEP